MTKGKAKQFVPVSERALVARINRRLRPDCQRLLKTRSERARMEVGNYYLFEFRRNRFIQGIIDIEKFGRELGVLKAYERLDETD